VKVALVCDWYRPRLGGIELHLADLAQRLIAGGHEVVVVTPTPGEGECDGVPVRRIRAATAPKFGFLLTPGGVRALGAAIAEEAPDVVHAHVSIVSPAALGGALHSVRRGIPTVVTFHSFVQQTRVLAAAVGAVLGARRWTAVFTAVSGRVAREVQPFTTAPIRVMPNGIDAGFWRPPVISSEVHALPVILSEAHSPPVILSEAHSPPVILSEAQRSEGPAVPHFANSRSFAALRMTSVMRLNRKKRPLALVAMMKKLREFPLHLRIAGDGPERAALERAIDRAGLGDRIELLGRRTREEIRTLLGESDLFVLPTVRESFGLAALEARCAGVPVVAMAESGVAELIEHGREGLLARSDDELAEHVAWLARDRDRVEEMRCHNQRTLPAFDWPRVIDAHLAAYRDAIALRDKVFAETNR
jgi:glycosyltransferase involved in cell wall biosynthesis